MPFRGRAKRRVLIIVLGIVSNIYFTLFGLLVTEIIPVPFLVVMMIGVRIKKRSRPVHEKYQPTNTYTPSTTAAKTASQSPTTTMADIELKTVPTDSGTDLP